MHSTKKNGAGNTNYLRKIKKYKVHDNKDI